MHSFSADKLFILPDNLSGRGAGNGGAAAAHSEQIAPSSCTSCCAPGQILNLRGRRIRHVKSLAPNIGHIVVVRDGSCGGCGTTAGGGVVGHRTVLTQGWLGLGHWVVPT